MTDLPYRTYGPQPLNGGAGETLYTAPTGTSKFFIRDITLSNLSASTINVKLAVGDIAGSGTRVYDKNVAASTATFIRPLWLLDAGETLEGLQKTPSMASAFGVAPTTIGSGTDASSYASTSWVPAAATLYFLLVTNGVASGTTALNPSSITGNGSWTLIAQTTSTASANANGGVAAYWWYSSTAGSAGTTTVNFSSTQHSCVAAVFPMSGVYSGATAIPPWTSSATPIIQSAAAADTASPASTNQSKIVTLAALQSGVVFYYCAKFDDNETATPPTGFTEGDDRSFNDLTGSIAKLSSEASVVTTPPGTTTVGPATFSVTNTLNRASIAWEVVPSAWVNCMVNGIEVR